MQTEATIHEEQNIAKEVKTRRKGKEVGKIEEIENLEQAFFVNSNTSI